MTPAEAALDALRRWAATNRADLVAAAWHAGNRNITALSAAAGRGRDVIYADLRARNIDPKSDRQEPPVPITETPGMTELPIAGWRHPHLLKVSVKTEYPGTTFQRKLYQIITKPFTGHEPEPEIPAEWNTRHPSDNNIPDDQPGGWDQWSQRNREIDLVRKVWAQARFDYLIGQLLKGSGYSSDDPAKTWATYAAARDNLKAAYAALDTTPDNQWKSALLAIHDAKKPAELAASNWDYQAAKFAEQDKWLLRQLGEEDHPYRGIVDAAAKHGVDVSDWLIGSDYDYEHGSWGRPPACNEIHKIIETGDERIKAVAQMLKTR